MTACAAIALFTIEPTGVGSTTATQNEYSSFGTGRPKADTGTAQAASGFAIGASLIGKLIRAAMPDSAMSIHHIHW